MSGLRVWAGVREHARVLAMPVKFLMSPVVGTAAGLCATVPPASTGQRAVRTIRVTIAHPQRLFRAGLRAVLGSGRRLRARRPRRRQPAREVAMLIPKVTELSRGSAHPSATGPAKASAISRQGG